MGNETMMGWSWLGVSHTPESIRMEFLAAARRWIVQNRNAWWARPPLVRIMASSDSEAIEALLRAASRSDNDA